MDENSSGSDNDTDSEVEITFSKLGIVPALCDAIEAIGWKKPTEIQAGSIPEAMKGRDIIGLAETGSKNDFSIAFIFTR